MEATLVDLETLGLRLRLLRMAAHLRITQVAEATGIPDSTISRWELGKGGRYPDVARLAQIARLYRVGLDELLDPESGVEWRIFKKRPKPDYLARKKRRAA